MTLTDFLLARIAEDETQARSALVLYGSGMHPLDPARILADCEAKRRIVRDAVDLDDEYAGIGLRAAVRHLASAYADHPDFSEDWLT